MDLNIGTLNINGMRAKQSQYEVKCIIDRYKLDILLLQETHIDSKVLASFLEHEYNCKAIWSFGTNKIAGVGILLFSSIDYKISKYEIDLDGRLIVLDLDIEGQSYRIINLYAPNDHKKRKEFFNELVKHLVCNRVIIMGGDFNCVTDTKLDKFGNGVSFTLGKQGSSELSKLCFDYGLIDIFRHNNPRTIVTTWHFSGNEINCRLDRFYISKCIEPDNIKFDFIPISHSDHDLVIMQIPKSHNLESGPNYWKFNNDLLQDVNFIHSFTLFWKYQMQHFDHSLYAWDQLKSKMKYFCICASKRISREKYNNIHTLRNEYSKLIKREKQQPGSFSEQIDNLKSKIKALQNKQYNGAKIRAKVKVFDDNENVSNYFHKKERQNAQKKRISLIEKDGKTYSSTGDILNCFTQFYTDLYTVEPIDNDIADMFLEDLPSLSSDDADSLETEITTEEVLLALKSMDNNKSPGSDGLTKEFYLSFFNLIGPVLTKVIDTVFNIGEMSESQKLSYITLLCKDPSNASNMKYWRPISLLNLDYKLISKVLTNRLGSVIATIVHPDQTCSVKSRSILDNVHLLRNIIDYVDQKNLECIFLNLDQEKAFDRVSHDFLFKTLRKFGFKENFIRWIKILYTDVSASVLVNNFISERFPILRGVHQGCSLSPLLYVIILEPFANKIRRDPLIKGLNLPGTTDTAKISLYADDSTAICTNLKSVARVLGTCRLFQDASGSKLNLSKTKGMFLGKWKTRSDHPFGISWIDNCKLLGNKLGNFLTEDSKWSDIYIRFLKCLNLCRQRQMPLKGKAMIINTLACAKLWYCGSTTILHKHYLQLFIKESFKYLWVDKVDPISRNSAYLPFKEGGLNIVNIELKLKSFLLNHVQQLINDREAKWTYFAIYWIGLFLRNHNSSFASLSIPHCDVTLIPPFYKSCLDCYRSFKEKYPDMQLGNFPVKQIYNALLKHEDYKHVITRKLPLVNFSKVWPVLLNKFIDPFARDVSWKIIHNILPLNQIMFQRHISKKITCELCNLNTENASHVFYECTLVKPLYSMVINWISNITKGEIFSLSLDVVLLNWLDVRLSSVYNDMVIMLLTECKFAIWLCRLRAKYENKRITSNVIVMFFLNRLKTRIFADYERMSLSNFINHWCITDFCTIDSSDKLIMRV